VITPRRVAVGRSHLELAHDHLMLPFHPAQHVELLLAQDASNAAPAEKSFRTAIEISRKQHAESWELRATMSLARLLAKRGRRDDARKMPAQIYGWFTEGFETADLKEVKALLDELNASPHRCAN
jgi:predicted ATPase